MNRTLQTLGIVAIISLGAAACGSDDPDVDAAETPADVAAEPDQGTSSTSALSSVENPSEDDLSPPVALEAAAEAIIGLDLAAAEVWAEKHDMSVRVIVENGENLSYTEDYSPNRINVATNDGNVADVLHIS